jgi:hypothetical protein
MMKRVGGRSSAGDRPGQVERNGRGAQLCAGLIVDRRPALADQRAGQADLPRDQLGRVALADGRERQPRAALDRLRQRLGVAGRQIAVVVEQRAVDVGDDQLHKLRIES